MEGQEYLNQISALNRPTKKSGNGILSSKLLIGGVIALVALIAMIIFGAIMGGNKGGEKNLSYKLKLHLDNTATLIQTYQSDVKSSDLRSSSASLYSILSNTSKDLTNYLVEKYNFKEKDIDKKFVEQADLERDDLDSTLFKAKITGTLDRIYAHKMAYEISMLMNEETAIIGSSKNDTLRGLLETSYDSLENLYTKFSDFSETK